MSKISVLGAGGWGLALSLAFLKKGCAVTVWTPFEDEAQALIDNRESRLLPGVKIPREIKITTDIKEISGSDFTVIATPSTAVRQTAKRLQGTDCGNIVSVAKGIEYESLLRLSQVIKEELPQNTVTVLSGPSHAEEVAVGIETSLVASSKDMDAAYKLQNVLSSDKLRIYTNPDTVGVELGGALKNILAIASGFCCGLKLGDNTRAALITRGLAEMARLGIAMGAREQTFAGLSGLGDLIVTCTSRHSRNNRFGILVGEGMPVSEALEKVGTVEGYYAARTAYKLSEKYKTDMPITQQCYKIMYEDMPLSRSVSILMNRPCCPETEKLWS